MTRCRLRGVAQGLVLAASLAITGQVQALDVRCERGRLVRDVEVRLAQDADGLPCEVIWQTAVGAEQGSWFGAAIRGSTSARTRRALVHRLIDDGWTCESEVAAEGSRPVAVARLEPAAPEADAALPLDGDPGLDDQIAPSARHAPDQGARPDQAVLQAALARDVERLDELSESIPGRFQAQMARLGDLDGDGVEDAAALLIHRPEGAPPSLHLLAYRFDGETFQPVARLALMEASNAQIQGIVDGVIEVIAHVAQPGDPTCCPSGRRRASFVLREDGFVRLPDDQPGT